MVAGVVGHVDGGQVLMLVEGRAVGALDARRSGRGLCAGRQNERPGLADGLLLSLAHGTADANDAEEARTSILDRHSVHHGQGRPQKAVVRP